MKLLNAILSGLFYILTITSAVTPKLAMYWVDNPITPIVPLESTPSWVDIVLIGFATINSDSTLTFPYNQSMIQNGVKSLHMYNQTVFLSIGGAANCGPNGISQDLMFGMSNFNATTWANDVYNLMNMYGFDGVDIDYECRDKILQNPVNVKNALIELRNILPNITISFVAFSVVDTPKSWENYKDAFISIQPYIDVVFWATYNVNLNPVLANDFYSKVNLTSISQFGYNTSSIFYGYCVGTGCVYGPGPINEQIILWANDVKQKGDGGLFLWSIQDELNFYNFTYFNTSGISKQVADILHF